MPVEIDAQDRYLLLKLSFLKAIKILTGDDSSFK
jgi:hypothetical protein